MPDRIGKLSMRIGKYRDVESPNLTMKKHFLHRQNRAAHLPLWQLILNQG